MKTNLPAFFAAIILLLSPVCSHAQKWKAYRYDLIYGVGAANFLGDLGGANNIATHYIKDLDWGSTRQAATLGLRYKMGEYLSLRTSFNYARLKGDDKQTQEYYRNYRNLSFASNIWELTTNLECAFMKEQSGKKYRLRGVRGKRGYEVYTYVFVGVGLFHFNPKAKDSGGQWVALQPLHTEGQGLIPTRKKYKRTSMVFPFGIGFKYAINRRYSIGLEYGMRLTFTDYIDDVSTTYVDPALLKSQPNGLKAVEMADRSPQTDPMTTRPGEQRGDARYTDSYMLALLTLNYKLRSTKGYRPKF